MRGARAVWLALLAGATGLVLGLGASARPEVPEPAAAAARYLAKAQRPDGWFRYEYDLVTGAYRSGNNLVRQAGAAYGLGEYLHLDDDPEIAAVLRRALQALADASVPYRDGRLVTLNGDLKGAKTGATALALLAEASYQQATGEQRFATVRRDWLRGLLALRHAGGGFAKAPGRPEESAYYNGEAWLALASHEQAFPGEPLLGQVLLELDDYLIERMTRTPDIGFYHWGAMAAQRRYQSTKSARFARFATEQTIALLERLRPQVHPDANSCYAVEGLLATATLLSGQPEGSELRERIEARVRAEMAKNLGLQVQAGQTELTLGPGRRLIAPELPQFAGAFLAGRDRPRLRIDFTQHCLSALLKLAAAH